MADDDWIADEPQAGYRPCVGILLLNNDNRIFLGRRNDQKTAEWQMPQGGIDAGETPRQAGFRELEEEVGTRAASLIRESSHWYAYDLPPGIAGKRWSGRYRGQTQKWLALRFTGIDADIDIATAEPEFADWTWCEPDRVVAHAVAFKRRVYERVVDEFRPLWA